MGKSIVIFGAGPGLGQAVAHRWAAAGYDAVLVGRRLDKLTAFARMVQSHGTAVSCVVADLAEPDSIGPMLSAVRGNIGDPDAVYFSSNPGGGNAGFMPASALEPEPVARYMGHAVYALMGIVNAFLPAMVRHGTGTIVVAQGAAALEGRPYRSGPGLALAAQRNYLQSLQGEVSSRGIFVGRFYIGAAIVGTPFFENQEAAKAAGTTTRQFPTVEPSRLADLLWNMVQTDRNEISYPAA